MKNSIKTVTLTSLALALVVPAWSADESFVGKWKAEFDSQVGKQKYTFEFKLEEGKLAGKAIGERQMGTNEVKLVEIKTDKDEISFVEPLTLQGNTVRIIYNGKLKDDEIKLHRNVTDIAEYDIVAKRVKETDAKAETKSEPKNNWNQDGNRAAREAIRHLGAKLRQGNSSLRAVIKEIPSVSGSYF